ncbi:MAG: hypothetical protein WA733_03180 [Methylocystis sp.]
MERFGRPGISMPGSDSHTPAAGLLCTLAIGRRRIGCRARCGG